MAGQTDRHPEAGIAVRDNNIAAVMPDDRPCDRQTQADAAGLPVTEASRR